MQISLNSSWNVGVLDLKGMRIFFKILWKPCRKRKKHPKLRFMKPRAWRKWWWRRSRTTSRSHPWRFWGWIPSSKLNKRPRSWRWMKLSSTWRRRPSSRAASWESSTCWQSRSHWNVLSWVHPRRSRAWWGLSFIHSWKTRYNSPQIFELNYASIEEFKEELCSDLFTFTISENVGKVNDMHFKKLIMIWIKVNENL